MANDPGLVNVEARGLLGGLIDRLTRDKAVKRSWGSTQIEITWEDGRAKLARIKDEVTHKFPA